MKIYVVPRGSSCEIAFLFVVAKSPESHWGLPEHFPVSSFVNHTHLEGTPCIMAFINWNDNLPDKLVVECVKMKYVHKLHCEKDHFQM